MLNTIGALALRTLRDPRRAAGDLIGMELPLPVLWTALALAAVLNATLFSLNLILFPTGFPLPGLFYSPIFNAILMAGGLAVMIWLLTRLGGVLGGTARLADVAVLLVWLQYLRIAAQVVLLMMALLMPSLGLLATLAVGLVSLWILLQFVDVAHGFASLGKTILLLFLTVIGITMGLAVFLALIGAPAPEMS